MLDSGCGYWIMDVDTEYWILDTGYWILDTGYSMLDTNILLILDTIGTDIL